MAYSGTSLLAPNTPLLAPPPAFQVGGGGLGGFSSTGGVGGTGGRLGGATSGGFGGGGAAVAGPVGWSSGGAAATVGASMHGMGVWTIVGIVAAVVVAAGIIGVGVWLGTRSQSKTNSTSTTDGNTPPSGDTPPGDGGGGPPPTQPTTLTPALALSVTSPLDSSQTAVPVTLQLTGLNGPTSVKVTLQYSVQQSGNVVPGLSTSSGTTTVSLTSGTWTSSDTPALEWVVDLSGGRAAVGTALVFVASVTLALETADQDDYTLASSSLTATSAAVPFSGTSAPTLSASGFTLTVDNKPTAVSNAPLVLEPDQLLKVAATLAGYEPTATYTIASGSWQVKQNISGTVVTLATGSLTTGTVLKAGGTTGISFELPVNDWTGGSTPTWPRSGGAQLEVTLGLTPSAGAGTPYTTAAVVLMELQRPDVTLQLTSMAGRTGAGLATATSVINLLPAAYASDQPGYGLAVTAVLGAAHLLPEAGSSRQVVLTLQGPGLPSAGLGLGTVKLPAHSPNGTITFSRVLNLGTDAAYKVLTLHISTAASSYTLAASFVGADHGVGQLKSAALSLSPPLEFVLPSWSAPNIAEAKWAFVVGSSAFPSVRTGTTNSNTLPVWLAATTNSSTISNPIVNVAPGAAIADGDSFYKPSNRPARARLSGAQYVLDGVHPRHLGNLNLQCRRILVYPQTQYSSAAAALTAAKSPSTPSENFAAVNALAGDSLFSALTQVTEADMANNNDVVATQAIWQSLQALDGSAATDATVPVLMLWGTGSDGRSVQFGTSDALFPGSNVLAWLQAARRRPGRGMNVDVAWTVALLDPTDTSNGDGSFAAPSGLLLPRRPPLTLPMSLQPWTASSAGGGLQQPLLPIPPPGGDNQCTFMLRWYTYKGTTLGVPTAVPAMNETAYTITNMDYNPTASVSGVVASSDWPTPATMSQTTALAKISLRRGTINQTSSSQLYFYRLELLLATAAPITEVAMKVTRYKPSADGTHWTPSTDNTDNSTYILNNTSGNNFVGTGSRQLGRVLLTGSSGDSTDVVEGKHATTSIANSRELAAKTLGGRLHRVLLDAAGSSVKTGDPSPTATWPPNIFTKIPGTNTYASQVSVQLRVSAGDGKYQFFQCVLGRL